MPPEDSGPNELHNGWREWSRHVLTELERLNKTISSVHKEINNLRNETVLKEDHRDLRREFDKFKLATATQLAVLKTKSALIGAVSGLLVGGLITALLGFLSQ